MFNQIVSVEDKGVFQKGILGLLVDFIEDNARLIMLKGMLDPDNVTDQTNHRRLIQKNI